MKDVYYDFEQSPTRQLAATDCIVGKGEKECQNGGTATGDVCDNNCACDCPSGTSGDWCECLDCHSPDKDKYQWAVSTYVSCETGPTCDCSRGNGLSCKAVTPQYVWKPTHNEGLCGKTSCSDDTTKRRFLEEDNTKDDDDDDSSSSSSTSTSSTPSASTNAVVTNTTYGGCCSSPSILRKGQLSPTPLCRVNPEQYTVVQVCFLNFSLFFKLVKYYSFGFLYF